MDSAFDTLATLGQAMAHPTRLRILDALAREEACVCHLMAMLDARQAHVSQHLRVLKDAGLVNDRRDAQMVHYSLADSRTAAIVSLLKDLSRTLDASLTYPEMPVPPLAGCACPHCAGAPQPATSLAAACC